MILTIIIATIIAIAVNLTLRPLFYNNARYNDAALWRFANRLELQLIQLQELAVGDQFYPLPPDGDPSFTTEMLGEAVRVAILEARRKAEGRVPPICRKPAAPKATVAGWGTPE
jgi:hypothetical protein